MDGFSVACEGKFHIFGGGIAETKNVKTQNNINVFIYIIPNR